MIKYSKTILIVALAIIVLAQVSISKTTTNSIQSGKLYLRVYQTLNSQPQLFQVSYDSSVKTQLKLTQSSKIEIQAKMKFKGTGFQPQLFSARLIHPQYDKLTQPVKFAYDSQSQSFKCVIDLGDPRTIQPYSDMYKLELIIADQRLSTNFRSLIATTRISFRHSISQQKIPTNLTPISYNLPQIIQTKGPEQRIDPPLIFTYFVLAVMGLFSILFLYALFGYLKANLSLIPRDGLGLVLNLALIALIGVNLAFLAKFWLEWNFIKTIGNFTILIIVTVFVANYALLYMKNRQ